MDINSHSEFWTKTNHYSKIKPALNAFTHLIYILTVSAIPCHSLRTGPTAVPWEIECLHAGHALKARIGLTARTWLMKSLKPKTWIIKIRLLRLLLVQSWNGRWGQMHCILVYILCNVLHYILAGFGRDLPEKWQIISNNCISAATCAIRFYSKLFAIILQFRSCHPLKFVGKKSIIFTFSLIHHFVLPHEKRKK